MTKREMFFNRMAVPPSGPVPNWEFGLWPTTLPNWHAQGLPKELDTAAKVYKHFGIDSPHFGGGYFLPACALRLCPGFPGESLGVHDGQALYKDGDGVTYAEMVEGDQSIPHYLDYPIKGRKEWEELYKPRLAVDAPGRFPDVDWEAVDREYAASGAPRFLYLDSFMGYIRNLMGFENFAMLAYDDPELLEDMVETLTRIKEAWLDRLSGKTKLDMVHYWEDICYNAGPMINPDVFRDIVVPRIKRVNDRLRQEFDCTYICVDCDGNFEALMEGWIASGVNILMPCEVDAGMDILRLQDTYQDRCGFHGGIQKKALSQGSDAIRAELERVLPAVERGGYIPHLDHGCPANVPLTAYKEYLQLKREVLGCV